VWSRDHLAEQLRRCLWQTRSAKTSHKQAQMKGEGVDSKINTLRTKDDSTSIHLHFSGHFWYSDYVRFSSEHRGSRLLTLADSLHLKLGTTTTSPRRPINHVTPVMASLHLPTSDRNHSTKILPLPTGSRDCRASSIRDLIERATKVALLRLAYGSPLWPASSNVMMEESIWVSKFTAR